MSTKNESDFGCGCTETVDFTDRLQGFRGMVCHERVTMYIYIYIYIRFRYVYIYMIIYDHKKLER